MVVSSNLCTRAFSLSLTSRNAVAVLRALETRYMHCRPYAQERGSDNKIAHLLAQTNKPYQYIRYIYIFFCRSFLIVLSSIDSYNHKITPTRLIVATRAREKRRSYSVGSSFDSQSMIAKFAWRQKRGTQEGALMVRAGDSGPRQLWPTLDGSSTDGNFKS